MDVAVTLGASVRLRLFAALLLCSGSLQADQHYLIVSGLGGEPEYEEAFAGYGESLAEAARRSVTEQSQVIVLSGAAATQEAVRSNLEALAGKLAPADTVAVFLLGHGSYDGEEYKFNLPGPDMTGADLAALLAALPAESQLVVNATSASGAVLEDWTSAGRTLITATRSGAERNATRFPEYWAEALSSDEADLNKNGVVTAQEAFDFASRRVEDSYESEDALATEHAQLVGDEAPRFNAARLVARSVDTPQLRQLNEQLAALERQIDEHRLRREELEPDRYLTELQELLVELALVQRQIDAASGAGADE
jgi:pimeloyl-ACP methyl ester carboxylesterase